MLSRRMARGRGGAVVRPCRRRSTTTSAAGKTVIMATHESRMAVPEMKPISWRPRKIGEHQDGERPRRRHRAQQHAGAAAGRRDLDGLAQVAAEEEFLFVAEEEIDAV